MLSIADICSAISASPSSSPSGFLWAIIVSLWPWYWLWISLLIIAWVTFEIQTRNGTVHYNSKNGFSPSFNRFVGSGTYLGLQTLLYLLFKLILGEAVYCMVWPWMVHALVFLSTGLLLHLAGFWPYLKEPGKKRRSKKRNH